MIHNGTKIRGIVDAMCKKGVLRVHAVDQVMKLTQRQGNKVGCERCNKPSMVTTGSFFDTKMICLDCRSLEEKHPAYKQAKETESAEVGKGNYNFAGVGLPQDWDVFAYAYSLKGFLADGEYNFQTVDIAEVFNNYCLTHGWKSSGVVAGHKRYAVKVEK